MRHSETPKGAAPNGTSRARHGFCRYLNVLANQELAIPRGWQERKKYRAFFGGRAATHEKGIRASCLEAPQRDVTDDEPRQGAGLWPREGDSRARSGPAPVGRVVCISKIVLPGRHVFRGGIVRLIGSHLAAAPEPSACFLNFAPCKGFGLVAGLSRSPLPTAADQV